MPVYKNLNAARMAFHQLKLKKTGKNPYTGHSYFELSDFLPSALQIMADHDLCATILFRSDVCFMQVVDTVDGSSIMLESPTADAQTKGSLPIQALGSTHTYMRRYMWNLVLEIVEHDGIEATIGKKGNEPVAYEAINPKQLAELHDLIEKTGASIETMCDYYKVAVLDELPESKFEAAKAILSKRLG